MTALNKQALREAAEKAIGAHERLSIMPSDDIFDISLHEGTQLDADITDLNAFNEAANPATVLALLDDLEAAEKRISELEARAFNPAILDVLAERQRQVSAEGWTPAHDDQHRNNDMAFAAACYAFHSAAASWDLEDDGVPYDSHPVPKNWPWEPDWWKPTDPRRDLVKAGALIIAEIERIDRAAGIGVKGE